MKVRTIISGIILTTIGFGSEVSAGTPNVSFGFGPDGVSFNLSTYPVYYYDGMCPPPPPRHHRPHYRGFVPTYFVPMSPKQYDKAVKKYMKQQKKYAKKYYKHQRKHHHHHHDDYDD